MPRTFDMKPATREATPLLIGLVSPSGAGKTYSALRLATGIQRVAGGKICVIDTEARRSLHYADMFRFSHLPMGAPFSSLDYLAAIEHAVANGAKTIIIDSMSHEHAGSGGMLEQHEAETNRMSGGDYKKAERVKMLAWQKPKSGRRKLINAMLQIDCNFIWCFRAKEKLKLVKGAEPEQLGWMPIAGDEFVYEATLKLLMLPGANGYPVMRSDFEGERAMIKVPTQFRAMFERERQIDEAMGEELARWAAGTAAPADVTVSSLLRSYEACADAATFRSLEESRKRLWAKANGDEKAKLKSASDAANEAIAAQSAMADESDLPVPDAEDAQ